MASGPTSPGPLTVAWTMSHRADGCVQVVTVEPDRTGVRNLVERRSAVGELIADIHRPGLSRPENRAWAEDGSAGDRPRGERTAGEAVVLQAARRAVAVEPQGTRFALLILDEIQCGVGRLGTLFAFKVFGVTPDVVTIAKALTNGLPIGVLLAGECAAAGFMPGDHGSTFGGSPISCAAALAHLRVRDELDLDTLVNDRSERLFADLHDLSARFPDHFDAPRGMGSLIGLPVRPPFLADAIRDAARERGLLVGMARGNPLRFAPPLIVSKEDIARALARLEASQPPLAAKKALERLLALLPGECGAIFPLAPRFGA